MIRKLSLVVAAVSVLAFVVPALASAAPAVTITKGTLAPVTNAEKTGPADATITGISTNVETTNTPLGTLKCKEFMVSGWLTKNNGTEVQAVDDPGAGNSAKECVAGTTELKIDNPTLVSLSATAKAKTVDLSFTSTAGGLSCTYTGTAVPFTYTAGGSSIHIAGALKGSTEICGSPEIHGDFALSITGAAVILD
jgi:hypothetical protein